MSRQGLLEAFWHFNSSRPKTLKKLVLTKQMSVADMFRFLSNCVYLESH